MAAPNSTPPGPDWFYYYSYPNKNMCDYYGYLLVINGYVSGSSCAPRYDLSGYDLWLRN